VFSTILLHKIVENTALKNITWRRQPPKDVPGAFLHSPRTFVCGPGIVDFAQQNQQYRGRKRKYSAAEGGKRTYFTIISCR